MMSYTNVKLLSFQRCNHQHIILRGEAYIMNKYLTRGYYETDNTFFKQHTPISCREQMAYQSLRDYSVDYFLIFCDDINIAFCNISNQAYVKPHDLGYNYELFTNHIMTTQANHADICISHILGKERFAIFQTAMDALHTSCWYHDTEPYTHISHNAMIIGENTQYYFYVDSPPMRNPKYFIPHPDNPSVGCIPRQELLDSFRHHCCISYIDINTQTLQHLPTLIQILKGIKASYYTPNTDNTTIGKSALENFAIALHNHSCLKQILSDSFKFDLIASRHIRLKQNMERHMTHLPLHVHQECIDILDILHNRWRLVTHLSIKYMLTFQVSIAERISHIVKTDILPLTERFISKI